MTPGEPTGSPGINAALSSVEALAARGPMSLAELAATVRAPKSTVHRVSVLLLARGWLVRRPDGRLDLGIRAIGIGARAGELPLVTAFRATAARLLTQHDETVTLAVVDGDETVFVAVEETSQPVRFVTQVGHRAPIAASASGRVFLANRPRDDVVGDFGGRPLVTPTGRRLDGIGELLAILDEVNRRGYAENDEETAPGLHAVAVPVRSGAGVVLAALTVCVPTARMTAERRSTLVTDLIVAGRRLSSDVAWVPAWNAVRSEFR